MIHLVIVLPTSLPTWISINYTFSPKGLLIWFIWLYHFFFYKFICGSFHHNYFMASVSVCSSFVQMCIITQHIFPLTNNIHSIFWFGLPSGCMKNFLSCKYTPMSCACYTHYSATVYFANELPAWSFACNHMCVLTSWPIQLVLHSPKG